MSESTTATTGLTSQYAAQVTTDLEQNIKEQERISGDITALHEQLAALQHDHSVLVNVQQALGVAPTPVRPATAPDSTVPAPRENASTEPSTGKRRRVKKAADVLGRKTTKKQASKKPTTQKPASNSAAAKAAQATLVELVRRHLTEQSEPRSAAEVVTALATAHPERGIKTTVVRTILEGLVAKNRAQRTKQGASVYYTAPTPTSRQSRPPRTSRSRSQPSRRPRAAPDATDKLHHGALDTDLPTRAAGPHPVPLEKPWSQVA